MEVDTVVLLMEQDVSKDELRGIVHDLSCSHPHIRVRVFAGDEGFMLDLSAGVELPRVKCCLDGRVAEHRFQPASGFFGWGY